MIFPGDVCNFNYLTGVDVRQIFQANEKQKQPPEVLYKKKVFLEISQDSQENTCARVSLFNKVAGFSWWLLLKKLIRRQAWKSNNNEIQKHFLVLSFENNMIHMKLFSETRRLRVDVSEI